MAKSTGTQKPTESAVENEETLTTSQEQERQRLEDQVSALTDELESAKRTAESLASSHKSEVRRLEQLVEHLQGQLHSSSRVVHKTVTATPETCLAMIITKLQEVAVGGPAADLRLTVHQVAAQIDRDGCVILKEYTSRLRGAADAVDQEAATLLLV